MRKLFLYIFFTFGALCSWAQQDSTAITYDTAPLVVKEINDDELKKYRNDEAFDYEFKEVERTWWDDFKTWSYNLMQRIFEAIFGIEKASGLLSGFLKLLPYLLLGLLCYLLIKFFLKVNANALRQARNGQPFVALSEEENIIKNEDIQQLIRKALTDKDYRLAIRYYYLHLLKLMSEKDLISWELQKTNDDYLKEIKKTELALPFSTITRLYDYIWYGEFPIDEARYLKAEKAFLSLQKMLRNNG